VINHLSWLRNWQRAQPLWLKLVHAIAGRALLPTDRQYARFQADHTRCRACGEPIQWVTVSYPTFKRLTLVDREGRNHFALCEWAEANAMDRVEVMAPQ
jgi:hypothetical protein